MRVIGGFRIRLALGAARFGTTDRGYARRLGGGGRREGRGCRLRAGAAAPGTPGLAFAALVGIPGGARLALRALGCSGRTRLAFASRLAAAARTVPRSLAGALRARLLGLAGR